MHVEVIYMLPESQGYYASVEVPEGERVLSMLDRLDFFTLFPEVDLLKNKIGIFGKQVSVSYLLSEGDRIEIYRPIYFNSKTARLAGKLALISSI